MSGKLTQRQEMAAIEQEAQEMFSSNIETTYIHFVYIHYNAGRLLLQYQQLASPKEYQQFFVEINRKMNEHMKSYHHTPLY
jgi:hypothetical protein